MKTYKKITDAVVKLASALIMLLIAGLVLVIVAELIYRNIFGKSFRATIEICGIMFLWMAFLGIICLYDNNRMLRFEILLTRVNGPVLEAFFYINKAFSLILGAVMVLSFINLYPFISTRYYSTIQWLPYSFQFFPIAITGGFIVVKTVYQLIERISVKGGGDR